MSESKSCANCKHFILRETTPKGGIKGICELSKADNFYYQQNGAKRYIKRTKCCVNYKGEKNEID